MALTRRPSSPKPPIKIRMEKVTNEDDTVIYHLYRDSFCLKATYNEDETNRLYEIMKNNNGYLVTTTVIKEDQI